MSDDCIFCQLLQNKEQTLVVHETENFRAWLDINPRAKGHTMVVPKEHLTSAEEVGENLLEMFDVARIVGEKAKNGIGAEGYSIVVNNGSVAGQMMDHFYMIVFPRFSGEEREETPTGAIFPHNEDISKEDLMEFMDAMSEASFNEYSGGMPTPDLEKDFSSEDEDGEFEKEISEEGSGKRKVKRSDSFAEFR